MEVVFLVGFGGLSRNCFGGNTMFSLRFFRGTGLGFTLSHFPVLCGGIGFIISSCSLMLSLGFLASCFNSNLISCDLLNLLRSFLFISILYDLVFKPLLGKSSYYYYHSYLYPYIYYSHISLSLFERTSLSVFRSVQMIPMELVEL